MLLRGIRPSTIPSLLKCAFGSADDNNRGVQKFYHLQVWSASASQSAQVFQFIVTSSYFRLRGLAVKLTTSIFYQSCLLPNQFDRRMDWRLSLTFQFYSSWTFLDQQSEGAI